MFITLLIAEAKYPTPKVGGERLIQLSVCGGFSPSPLAGSSQGGAEGRLRAETAHSKQKTAKQ